ncbi:MAG: tRNA epoxyqueuosine(34) reductase QueG, partial [Rikenellaceae bacterium]|nr:tRNA epoxyqueuosine(34) reductase QueG [Rikenellaceae bacterium]
MISRKNIVEIARNVGFSLCGTTTCDDVSEVAFFEQWLEKGYGSELPYLARRVEIRRSPRLLFDGARSVIVCAVNYRNAFSGGYSSDFE